MGRNFFSIILFFSILVGENDSQTYLILNEFYVPDKDVNHTLIDNFEYLDLQFEDILSISISLNDSLFSKVSDKINKIKELGFVYNVKYVLHNTIDQIDDKYIFLSGLYNTTSGGLIKQKSSTLINYDNFEINELNLWIGELTGGNKNEWEKNQQSVLFLAPEDIIHEKTPLKSALRSFAIPGWGQLYSNKKLEAVAWFGSELSLGILTYIFFKSYQNARNSFKSNLKSYNNSNDDREVLSFRAMAEQDWDNHKKYSEMGILCSKVIGLNWIVNSIHAYVVGPRPHHKIFKKW